MLSTLDPQLFNNETAVLGPARHRGSRGFVSMCRASTSVPPDEDAQIRFPEITTRPVAKRRTSARSGGSASASRTDV
jgi:hypothetical protein